MNLVTASIVTGAMAQCQEDEEMRRLEQSNRVKKLMPLFQKMFEQVDTEQTGSITILQVEDFAQSEHPEFKKALEYFEFESVLELFEVLDIDGSGNLDREEFVEGLVSLSVARHESMPRELYLMMKLMRTSKRSFRQIAAAIDDIPRHSPRAAVSLPLGPAPGDDLGGAPSHAAAASARLGPPVHLHEIDVTQW